MKTDIEIAQECTMEPITAIAEKAGIPDEYLEQYGKYKAKIEQRCYTWPVRIFRESRCQKHL
jgi:formyltetrahydrofolate synthetase